MIGNAFGKHSDIKQRIQHLKNTGLVISAIHEDRILQNGKLDLKDVDGSNILLIQAIRQGNLPAVKLLFDYFINYFFIASNGYTILHEAALSPNPAITSYLAKSTSLQDNHDKEGLTPLMLAVRAGNVAAARELIQLGSSLTRKDETGKSAQDYTRGNPALLDLFAINQAWTYFFEKKEIITAQFALTIRNTNNINATNNQGKTALELITADYDCDLDHVESMINSGARITLGMLAKQNAFGKSILHRAVIENRTNLVRMILQQGSLEAILITDTHGKNFLHYACENNRVDIIKIVLRDQRFKKQDILEAKDIYGRKPVDLASHSYIVDALERAALGDYQDFPEAKPSYRRPRKNLSQNKLNIVLEDYLVVARRQEMLERAVSDFVKEKGHQPHKQDWEQINIAFNHKIDDLRNSFLQRGGNCNGWSFLFLNYVSRGKLNEFFAILNTIADFESDLSVPLLAVLQAKYKNMEDFLENFTGQLIWFQASTGIILDFINIAVKEQADYQSQRDKQYKLNCSGERELAILVDLTTQNTYYNTDQIIEKFKQFSQFPGMCVDMSAKNGRLAHQIGFYVLDDGSFAYYDCNQEDLLPPFKSAEALADHFINFTAKPSGIWSENFGVNLKIMGYQYYPTGTQKPVLSKELFGRAPIIPALAMAQKAASQMIEVATPHFSARRR